MRTQILNYRLNLGYLCFGTVARLLNDKADRILSFGEVMSAVYYSSVARSIQKGYLKLDVHTLFEKSDAQLELLKVRSRETVKKK